MAISSEERKSGNRASAKRSIERKKYSAELEQTVEQNKRENVELKTIIERYERDIVTILSAIEHPSTDDATNQMVNPSQGSGVHCRIESIVQVNILFSEVTEQTSIQTRKVMPR